MSQQRPETLALHAGQQPDPATNALAVPIYQTTSYVFDDAQHAQDLFALAVPGNIYTRIMNPTWDVLEQRLAALEGGIAAVATASGQAAVTYSVLNLTRTGDNIVSVSTLYGGTYNLFAHTLPQYGIEVRFVDPDKPEDLAAKVDENTKLVFGETLGNPSANVLDVPAWADAAHSLGLPLIIDNTIATPVLGDIFAQGADIAVHALTKYIGGHGTSIGGPWSTSGKFDWTAHADRYPGTHEARSVVPRRGVCRTPWARRRTSAGSHRACCATRARRCRRSTPSCSCRASRRCPCAWSATPRTRWRGQWLEAHPQVNWVAYPGLPSSKYHEVAQRVLKGGAASGILTFGIDGGREAGRTFIESLKLFKHLVNIGDAKSLAVHPATTTHAQLNDDELASAGVGQDTVRLSIGIEHIDDIIADLEQALTAVREAAPTA